MTNSTQWALHKSLTPKGIIIHSTGRPAAYLRRYIQPSKEDENYSQLLAELGENRKHNDWNHIHTSYNFHYWIGKNNKNKVISVQTFPLDIKTWSDNYIHICLCEDNFEDEKYLTNCLTELIQICKEICNYFNWNESYIIDHSEISNFPDSNYWLAKYEYDINFIKNSVKNLTK